jgi:hypothetical protein
MILMNFLPWFLPLQIRMQCNHDLHQQGLFEGLTVSLFGNLMMFQAEEKRS